MNGTKQHIIILVGIFIMALIQSCTNNHSIEDKLIGELITQANKGLPTVLYGYETIDSVTWEKDSNKLLYHSSQDLTADCINILIDYGINQEKVISTLYAIHACRNNNFLELLKYFSDLNLDITYCVHTLDDTVYRFEIPIEPILSTIPEYRANVANKFAKVIEDKLTEANLLRYFGYNYTNASYDFFSWFFVSTNISNFNEKIVGKDNTISFITIIKESDSNYHRLVQHFSDKFMYSDSETVSQEAFDAFKNHKGDIIRNQLQLLKMFGFNLEFIYRIPSINKEYVITITSDMISRALIPNIRMPL